MNAFAGPLALDLSFAETVLGSEAIASLTEADRRWVSYWRQRKAEAGAQERAVIAEGGGIDMCSLPIARLASMVLEQSPAAWMVILADEFMGTIQ